MPSRLDSSIIFFTKLRSNHKHTFHSMTVTTKQDTIGPSNTNTVPQDIVVFGEATEEVSTPTLVAETNEDGTLPEPVTTRSSDLVVANNSHDASDVPEATIVVTETTTLPASNVPRPNLEAMKRRRVISQTTAGWIGAVTGLVVLGVPGAILGGIAGNKITKHSLKRMETKAKEDYELRLAEEQYTPANFNEEKLITHAVLA